MIYSNYSTQYIIQVHKTSRCVYFICPVGIGSDLWYPAKIGIRASRLELGLLNREGSTKYHIHDIIIYFVLLMKCKAKRCLVEKGYLSDLPAVDFFKAYNTIKA